MSVLRPLPPRPSLEYEHKEAKALLRRLRAGDPEALERALARHHALDGLERVRLADAQLVIAREYGFTSWPRLVRYFGEVDRQRYVRSLMKPNNYDGQVRWLLAEHRARRQWAGRSLACYVPRLYGASIADVFAATISEDEARLATARAHGFPSWDVMIERATEGEQVPLDLEDAWRDAIDAMEKLDLAALKRVIAANPTMLHPTDYWGSKGRTLLAMAVGREREKGIEAMRPIMDWLASQGLDLQTELNSQLCRPMRDPVVTVRYLLDRGADPNWVVPNGIPVLEHALIRLWRSAEAVDLIAARAEPRKALWIAAGLGDVAGVARFLDAEGRPIPAARKLRPDFAAVGPLNFLSSPEPDDHEILAEAFMVAMLHDRTAVLEYMVSRGFPLNTPWVDMPFVNFAVGNQFTAATECLIRCGADLDLRVGKESTARELAREMFEGRPDDAKMRRIAELCGLDPEQILAERNAKPAHAPLMAESVRVSLELAGDDAYRRGQSDIRPENLFIGLWRASHPFVQFIEMKAKDVQRFRAYRNERVLAIGDVVARPQLVMHADAQAVLQAAIAKATERRSDLAPVYLLWALTRPEVRDVPDLLARYGVDVTTLHPEVERSL
ncbi:MAG: hypothetical protein ACRENU_17105 [Gemmatimonadaceae bacterium]